MTAGEIVFNMEHCTGVDACEVNNDMEAVSYQLELLPTSTIGMAVRMRKYCVFYCEKMNDRRCLWIKIL